jgi:cyclopropane fatty-acyl-phospholipid synthase-like methyltransferase
MKRSNALCASLAFVLACGAITAALPRFAFGRLAVSAAQQPSTAPQETRPTSQPYSGDLSIFETKDRDKRLQIDRVMDLLGITKGSTVADIGAGSGWFTVRAAARVGSTGKVLAEEINPEAVSYIRNRTATAKITNVEVTLGSPDDPRLPAGAVDAVLMLKVYHEIAHPSSFLGHLRPALKPHAKVGIIDRNGNGADHGVQASVVIREMKQAGFALSSTYDFTKADGQDYFLIFEPR